MQIRYDRLVADIDRALVYDNVPPAERESDYRYWRAVSLARLALELSNGNDALTLDGMPVHFTCHYTDARRSQLPVASGHTKRAVEKRRLRQRFIMSFDLSSSSNQH